MDYELAKKLKEKGYKWNWCDYDLEGCLEECFPTLSDLIEACGDDFYYLKKQGDKFLAIGFNRNDLDIDGDPSHMLFEGKTSEIAVANLWLELQK